MYLFSNVRYHSVMLCHGPSTTISEHVLSHHRPVGDAYGRIESTVQRTNRPNDPRFANGRINSIDILEYYPIFCFDSLNERGITRSSFVSARSTDAAPATSSRCQTSGFAMVHNGVVMMELLVSDVEAGPIIRHCTQL